MSQPNLLELEAPIKICGEALNGAWVFARRKPVPDKPVLAPF